MPTILNPNYHIEYIDKWRALRADSNFVHAIFVLSNSRQSDKTLRFDANWLYSGPSFLINAISDFQIFFIFFIQSTLTHWFEISTNEFQMKANWCRRCRRKLETKKKNTPPNLVAFDLAKSVCDWTKNRANFCHSMFKRSNVFFLLKLRRHVDHHVRLAIHANNGHTEKANEVSKRKRHTLSCQRKST